MLTIEVRKGHGESTDLWFSLEDDGGKPVRQSVRGIYDRVAVVDVIAVVSRRFNPLRIMLNRPGKPSLLLDEETMELIRSGRLTADDFVEV